jgi:glycosyltransferase involved in cell wall biosynthesis
MRIAIVHDWLVTYAGAERVLDQILLLYPEADLYAVCDFVPDAQRTFLQGRTPRTTFIQRLPWARRKYRSYLPLMPLAIEQLDLSGYDLVISSSHAVAKGVLTGPDQLHLSLVYSPMRYAWELQHQYLREARLTRGLKSWLARWQLHKLRIWDQRTAHGVDHFVGISHYIKRRIRKAYGRDASVVYPPVAVDSFALQRAKQDFYLTASRMVPYKRMELIVRAFARMPSRKLVVIGDGPERKAIADAAQGHANIELRGRVEDAELAAAMGAARAFVFAAEEDFGIAPLEAQACGTPVIAYGRGGVRETVRGLDAAQPTGVFFDEQTEDALIATVERFEREGHVITPQACRANAERFSPERFRREFSALVEREWVAFQQRLER